MAIAPGKAFDAAVQPGQRGLQLLVAMAARPPSFRRDDDSGGVTPTKGALKAIAQFAAWGHYDDHRREHPLPWANRDGKRTKDDRFISLELLRDDFKKALSAGRLLTSSLLSRGRKDRDIVTFRFSLGNHLLHARMQALEHGRALREGFDASPNHLSFDNYKTRHWRRWWPTIHISAAIALMIDAKSQSDYEPMTEEKLFFNLLFRPSHCTLLPGLWNSDLPEFIVAIADTLAAGVVEAGLFPPAKMVRLNYG